MKAFVYAALLTLLLAQPALAGKGKNGQSGTSALSAQEISDLSYMREEEKLAHDLYVALDERWDRMVFANIADSEATHFSVLGSALARYGIADPALPTAGMFSDPRLQDLYDQLLAQGQVSVVAAFRTGALVEEVDIGDLDAAILATSHSDLQTAYGHLQCGSRNHLRAFVRNLEAAGVVYEAQVLTQARVDAILASSMERCGSN
ncbi:DUF2202 domain-containing protein [Parasulfuritortus cantonensis]|uniref:DUF2202 domain-containing protein n=1 Tax=Parasulfuritortus cantonensis TaxID=2528202 RepID=A0A4R1BGE8_9PROT|nr:DUF2202 domain-containing protein [Parasulfuritortus cantonensis]TCJ16261.1 DUF2202 domain-containing protein [Parasulfuritortus cantonensis]